MCVCVCVSPCSTVAVLLRAFFSRLSSAEPASARTRLSPCEEREGVRVNSLNWCVCDASRHGMQTGKRMKKKSQHSADTANYTL